MQNRPRMILLSFVLLTAAAAAHAQGYQGLIPDNSENSSSSSSQEQTPSIYGTPDAGAQDGPADTSAGAEADDGIIRSQGGTAEQAPLPKAVEKYLNRPGQNVTSEGFNPADALQGDDTDAYIDLLAQTGPQDVFNGKQAELDAARRAQQEEINRKDTERRLQQRDALQKSFQAEVEKFQQQQMNLR